MCSAKPGYDMAPLFLSKRELARAWQIVKVISRYGLVPLAQATGLGRLLGVWFWRRPERRYEEIPPPVRMRLALTELGTTFIKLGQMLSARSDLLPPEYLTELSELQDRVPPVPFSAIEPVFRADFGCSPFQAFAEFDPEPAASASIGQVYHARLHDGAVMMVKIQRPGVEVQVNTDLSLLAHLADFANRNHRLQRYDLPSLVREFRTILQDELVYTLEAHNAEALATEMRHWPRVIFPEVHWPYTSRHVLTTKRITGFKITDLYTLNAAEIDRKDIAVMLANSVLEQILLYGLFHGDPHPGNLIVTPEGNLAFIDTGMVGRLDRKTRELLIELAVSIFDQDIDATLLHLQQLGVVEEISDLPSLRRDLARLITKYYFLPRKELRLGELLQRVNHLLFEHHIRMAYEFGLLTKALFLAEGIALELDPYFDYNQAARPVIERIRQRYYSYQTFYDDAVRELRGMRRQVVDLPRRLSSVLSHLERGTLHVKSTDELYDTKQATAAMLLNRAIFAALTIALLIAASLLLSTHPRGWLGHVAMGILITDSLFMVLLLLGLLKSGRY